MLNPLVYAVVRTALSNVDQEAVLKTAVRVADAISQREGRPYLRRAARLISQSIRASESNPNDQPGGTDPVDAARALRNGPKQDSGRS